MKALVVIVPLYLILYYAFNLYTPKRVQGRRLEFSNVVMANIVGFLLILQYCTTCSLMWISFEIFPVRCSLFLCDQHGILEESFRLLIRQFCAQYAKTVII